MSTQEAIAREDRRDFMSEQERRKTSLSLIMNLNCTHDTLTQSMISTNPVEANNHLLTAMHAFHYSTRTHLGLRYTTDTGGALIVHVLQGAQVTVES